MADVENSEEQPKPLPILRWSCAGVAMMLIYLLLWYTISLTATQSLNVAELVAINDIEGVEWVLSWHNAKSNDIGQIINRPPSGQGKHAFLDDYPAIMIAIRQGDRDMCRRLTDAGAVTDATFKDKLGRNFIHLAVLAPLPEIVELANGSELLSARDSTTSGSTPLHLAVENRDHSMIELLIKAGARINAIDAQQLPAISRVSPDDEALMTRLLELGANPGLCPALLYRCVAAHNTDAVKRLLAAGSDPKASYKGNPMWHALFEVKGQTDESTAAILELLTAKGMRADQIDTDDRTSLYYASMAGFAMTCKALIKAGANLRWTDERNATPLYIAAERGHTEVVKALFDANADKNARLSMECGGLTALHAAAEKGHLEVVRFLAGHGAKLLVRSKTHEMAIHLAAANGHREIVETLLKEGNNVNQIVLGAEKTILDLALSSGNVELISMLKERGAKTFKQIEAEEAARRAKLRE